MRFGILKTSNNHNFTSWSLLLKWTENGQDFLHLQNRLVYFQTMTQIYHLTDYKAFSQYSGKRLIIIFGGNNYWKGKKSSSHLPHKLWYASIFSILIQKRRVRHRLFSFEVACRLIFSTCFSSFSAVVSTTSVARSIPWQISFRFCRNGELIYQVMFCLRLHCDR